MPDYNLSNLAINHHRILISNGNLTKIIWVVNKQILIHWSFKDSLE
jgi:hypothetical protein